MSEESKFKQITLEEKSLGYGAYFMQLFKRKKNSSSAPVSQLETNIEAIVSTDLEFNHHIPSNNNVSLIQDCNAITGTKISSLSENDTYSHERTLPNVLSRINHIMEKKGITPQQYKDSDFKQYWLPDHLRKECYDCAEKFTTLRRRHHCRVCGQIFCSKCCHRMIPGKVIGYKGELRVCTYCCKVLLSYLQSNQFEEEILKDLMVLRETLLPRTPAEDDPSSGRKFSSCAHTESARTPVRRFMEENYTRKCYMGDSNSTAFSTSSSSDQRESELASVEREFLLKDPHQLHALWTQMVRGPDRLPLATNRHRLRAFPQSFIGKDCVQWLVAHDKASSRESAVAVGQALLESGFIFCLSQPLQVFADEHVLYAILSADAVVAAGTPSDALANCIADGRGASIDVAGDDEGQPDWLKNIPPAISPPLVTASAGCASPPCASPESLYVAVDVQNRVAVLNDADEGAEERSRSSDIADCTLGESPLCDSKMSSSSPKKQQKLDSPTAVISQEVLEALRTLRASEAEARAAGWQRPPDEDEQPVPSTPSEGPPQLSGESEDEQTKLSLVMQQRFNELWSGHERRLLLQLLSSFDLDSSWAETVLRLATAVADVVRPDVKHDSDDMDIRRCGGAKKRLLVMCQVLVYWPFFQVLILMVLAPKWYWPKLANTNITKNGTPQRETHPYNL